MPKSQNPLLNVRRYPRFLLPLCALLLTACGLDQHVAQPKIEVLSINVTGRSDQGARIEATVKLTNPGSTALPLARAEYTFSLPSGKSFSFNDQCNRTLPAQGSQTLLLPAAFAVPGGQLAGSACSLTGSVTYQPPGQFRKLLTESGVPLPQVSFQHTTKLE